MVTCSPRRARLYSNVSTAASRSIQQRRPPMCENDDDESEKNEKKKKKSHPPIRETKIKSKILRGVFCRVKFFSHRHKPPAQRLMPFSRARREDLRDVCAHPPAFSRLSCCVGRVIVRGDRISWNSRSRGIFAGFAQ